MFDFDRTVELLKKMCLVAFVILGITVIILEIGNDIHKGMFLLVMIITTIWLHKKGR